MAKNKKRAIKIEGNIVNFGTHRWNAKYYIYEQLTDDHNYVGGESRTFNTRREARDFLRNVKACFFG